MSNQDQAEFTMVTDVERRRRRASIASLVGTTIEWYEYYVYGATAALAFPTLFFPTKEHSAGLMLSFASFGVAFLMRPIGAAVFGHFGDQLGRKRVLIFTVMLTGSATFLVGLLPTYKTIGVAAPILLTLLRVIQGFGVGGEWAGAALLSIEWGASNRRGASGSWPQLGTSVGLILSTLAVLLASHVTGKHFLTWGWRLPFLLTAPLLAFGMFIWMSVEEPPGFAQRLREGKIQQTPVRSVIAIYWREVILVAFLRLSEQMPFYIFTTFVLDYAVHSAAVSRTFVLMATLAAATVDLILLPVFSRLADRVGRRRMYFIGCGVLVLIAFPYFAVIRPGHPIEVFIAIALSLLPHAIQYGAQASLIAEQFPVDLRYTGAGVGYQISSLIAGGPAPLIATALAMKFNTGYAVAGYLVFGGLVAALALKLLKDRSDTAL
jgi:MFS family permease